MAVGVLNLRCYKASTYVELVEISGLGFAFGEVENKGIPQKEKSVTCSVNKWVVIAIGLFMSTFAFAKDGPCQVDIEKFCASVPKGREMAKCLATHKDELSPSCKGKYQEMKARVRSVREACLEDAEKFCAGLERNKFEPAAKAISRCLKGRETELSKECKESLGNKKRKRK